MKIRKHFRRPLAALLALIMTLALAPAAAAAVERCPYCDHLCEEIVLHEANCHESGVIKYVCTYSKCPYLNTSSQGYSILREVERDDRIHDMVYTDNGNGTHSGVCREHTAYTEGPDGHRYTNGLCELCGAPNYSAVIMDLPAEKLVPVAVNDSTAKLTAGPIRLTLGSANITDEYDLDYLWFDNSQGGRQVGDKAEYQLPSSIYGKKGTYYFILVVNANPKGTISRAPLSQTCRVTVEVDDRITASAIMTTEGGELRMGDANVWTPDSVSNQIYDAVQNICGRDARPSGVSFDDVTPTSIGRLSVSSISARYGFGDTSRNLEDVTFTSEGVPGEFTVGFTAYDTEGETYPGVLTITVQQYAGDMDVVYIASRNAPLTLSSKEFEAFWADIYPNGALEYIGFDKLPRPVDGTLYTEYASSVVNADTVRLADEFYVEPYNHQYGIDSVTFVPSVGVKQADYLTLEFTAYGTRRPNSSAKRSGVMYIFFVDEQNASDVTVTVPGTANAAGVALDPAAFQKAYQTVMGSTGTSFYIQLLGVPASGGLYLNRTTASNGILLTSSTIEDRLFAFAGSRVETIADLTYVPGTAASESVRYVASSAQGKPLFAGNIRFTSTPSTPSTPPATTPTGMVVDYSSTATGVTFKGSSFENLPGAESTRLTSVCFTPPSALFGTLYYGRSAVAAGTAITTDSNWFSVSPGAAGIKCIDDITFVPALSYTSGTVIIPFKAMNAVGVSLTGSVRITVGAAAPETPTPGTTTPGTTRPPKTFPDVAQSDYFYSYVTDLTTSGVLNGYDDGYFRPGNTVNLGEALKMIMTSVGYPEQAAVDSQWASGYLARAKADNLLPAGTIERLDRPVDRYTIAAITARAMKLETPSVTVSPFADMAVTVSAAPAVAALNRIQVLIGKPNAANQYIYQGEYAITRADFAIIIWRVQNYVRTGNVNGIVAQ